MQFTDSQMTLLATIDKYDGEWNWYKVGRLCLSKLNSPADFTLRPLLEARLIKERDMENEPLPRLFITDAGKAILRESGGHAPIAMKPTNTHEAISSLLLDVPAGFEAQVRRFSDAKCNDYSLPLHIIHGFLMDAERNPLGEQSLERFRGKPELGALADLVGSAVFDGILTMAPGSTALMFCDDFPIQGRRALSSFLAARTGGIEQGRSIGGRGL